MQTVNFAELKYVRLEYQRSTSLGDTDIGIRNFEFVAKTQFLCISLLLKTTSFTHGAF